MQALKIFFFHVPNLTQSHGMLTFVAIITASVTFGAQLFHTLLSHLVVFPVFPVATAADRVYSANE